MGSEYYRTFQARQHLAGRIVLKIVGPVRSTVHTSKPSPKIRLPKNSVVQRDDGLNI